jgi:hypothetical protein
VLVWRCVYRYGVGCCTAWLMPGKEPSMARRKVAGDGRDYAAERLLDSLLRTGRYHDAAGELDVNRLISDVRAVQVALLLTGAGRGQEKGVSHELD